MRRTSIVVVIFSGLLLALPALAQQTPPAPGKVTEVFSFSAKPGMNAKLEEGIKLHNGWHRKQNDPTAILTFQTVSGPGAGGYARVSFGHRWEDFDAMEKTNAADEADSATNMDPYIAGGYPSFYLFMPEVSRPPAGPTPSALAEVITFQLQPGSAPEFIYVIKKIHEAIGKTNWPVPYEWYALHNGGEVPEFVLVLPKAKWADFNEPEKPFDKMLEEAYGRQEAEALLRQFSKTIRSEHTELIRYRADLSYIPAAK